MPSVPLPLAGATEPLILLLAAFAADILLGGIGPADRLRGIPARLLRRIVRELDRRLNRLQRSQTERTVRGALVTAILVLTGALSGWVAAMAAAHPIGWLLILYLILAAIDLHRVWAGARRVGSALHGRSLDDAREALKGISARRVSDLDPHAVVRAAVEALARAFSQKFVAPAFWYILAGLPGMMAWLAADIADAEIGHQTGRYQGFGMAAARLDDILNWIPARLSALLLASATLFAPKTAPLAALRVMFTDARKHGSINAGWPEAALAGALGLSLGGPRREGEVLIRAPWIGPGRARATVADLRRARALTLAAAVLTAGSVAALPLALS